MMRPSFRQALLLLPVLAVLAPSAHVFAQEGYVLDGYGGIHAINGAPVLSPATPYFGFDAAESIEVLSGGAGYYVLDAFGGVHAGGSAPAPTSLPPYFGFDIARDMALVPAGGSSGTVIASPGTYVNVNGNDTKFQSLFGTSFSGTALGAGNLFPTPCTAGSLSARATLLNGSARTMVGSESVTMTVMLDEVDTTVSCTISTGQSQCTDADTVSVAAGNRLGYRITYSNLDTTSNGLFYLHKGFVCS